MKNTINILRVINLVASLGVTTYVAYKYAKQCGDIDILKNNIEKMALDIRENHQCNCNCCNDCEPETPSETANETETEAE